MFVCVVSEREYVYVCPSKIIRPFKLTYFGKRIGTFFYIFMFVSGVPVHFILMSQKSRKLHKTVHYVCYNNIPTIMIVIIKT